MNKKTVRREKLTGQSRWMFVIKRSIISWSTTVRGMGSRHLRRSKDLRSHLETLNWCFLPYLSQTRALKPEMSWLLLALKRRGK
jgi:hypothetical protein